MIDSRDTLCRIDRAPTCRMSKARKGSHAESFRSLARRCAKYSAARTRDYFGIRRRCRRRRRAAAIRSPIHRE